MKLSAKYILILERYLEWEHVTTPASGSFQELARPLPKIGLAAEGFSAAEALCMWESTGLPCSVRPDEAGLLARYIQGKSQRDWWTREIGWWNREASYIPEEFLAFLGPLPFIELFGRAPIARIVRYYFDNRYRLWQFRLDNLMIQKASEWNMNYYDRDDRHSAIRNAWRMVQVKWIAPATYGLKRRTQGKQFEA